jgi:hypothetical protein
MAVALKVPRSAIVPAVQLNGSFCVNLQVCLPPHLRVSGHPVPRAPDLAQGGELTLIKRRDQRVGPRRANMVLTAARRAVPASALPRSRRPAMSPAAAARSRSPLAVLRHTRHPLTIGRFA